MSVVSGLTAACSIRVQKKLSLPNQYGQSVYGWGEYGHQNNFAGIYQYRPRKKGRILVREMFYKPINPKYDDQIIVQTKFGDAVRAWQSLTDEQKAVYNQRIKQQHFCGYQLFIKEYMLAP